MLMMCVSKEQPQQPGVVVADSVDGVPAGDVGLLTTSLAPTWPPTMVSARHQVASLSVRQQQSAPRLMGRSPQAGYG
jgi:hypothetical protein